jgi:hypothetical protein
MKEYEDYFDWDLQIQSIDTCKDLTELEKKRAKEAFRYLKAFFGPIHPNNRIKIRHLLINTAPWTRKRLTNLGDSLMALETTNNFSALRRRIVKYTNHDEALSVLEVAIKFWKAGFIIGFDQEISVFNRKRKPDLEIVSNGFCQFCVEVSILGYSDQIKRNQRFKEETFGRMRQLNSSYRLFRNLTEDELPNLIEMVNLELKDAWEQRNSFYGCYSDILEFVISPIDKSETDHVQAVLEQRSLRFGKYVMPQENFDPLQALKNKIQKEAAQLPANMPNFVWIKLVDYSFFYLDLRKLLTELQSFIQRYEHIFALVVSNYWMGSMLEEFKVDENCFYKVNQADDVGSENLLVIINPSCKYDIYGLKEQLYFVF